jgi:Tol biopolymer transport system component
VTDARVIALIALAGCPARQDVECVDDTSCDLVSQGACIVNPATGHDWCSYPDDDCASGSRWSELDVGDGLAGTCAPEVARDPYAGGFAFVSRRDFDAEIYVMAADGAQPRNLSGDPGDDTQPRWSPDGSRIAFMSTRSGSSELYVMDADGSAVEELSDGSAEQAVWSPDGSTIVFTRRRSGGTELYRVPVDGSSPPVQVTSGGGTAPAWSPAGDRIAFERLGTIVVASSDGSNPTAVTTGDDSQPSWSPDGSRIAYVHASTAQLANVRIADVAGGEPIDVTPRTSLDSHPAWSPDGARVAFLRSASVYVANVDGTGIEPVTTIGHAEAPTWTLDGTAIVFASSASTDLEIVRVAVIGGVVTNLTNHIGDDIDATPRPSRTRRGQRRRSIGASTSASDPSASPATMSTAQ